MLKMIDRRAKSGVEPERLNFGAMPPASVVDRWQKRGLRLAVSANRGPEKYRLLDLRRRRAQIRARRALGVL